MTRTPVAVGAERFAAVIVKWKRPSVRTLRSRTLIPTLRSIFCPDRLTRGPERDGVVARLGSARRTDFDRVDEVLLAGRTGDVSLDRDLGRASGRQRPEVASDLVAARLAVALARLDRRWRERGRQGVGHLGAGGVAGPVVVDDDRVGRPADRRGEGVTARRRPRVTESRRASPPRSLPVQRCPSRSDRARCRRPSRCS